ncbi:MAG TPA: OsmC family protein [Thermoanaerobaculia bacterium]
MAVEMTGRYIGNLKTELTHGPSGTVIRTAAPVDNNGDGSSFSPTDLASASLGACMLTLIAIVGERDGLDLTGLSFRLEKHMASNPRRIGAVPVTIQMPAGLTPEQRKKLENAALTCPVHKSLSEDVEKPVEFVYPEESAAART